jgi:hypothetical protein
VWLGKKELLMLANVTFLESKRLYEEIAREQEAAHLQEMRVLADLAFVFLNATDGDSEGPAELLERSIELLYEGGTLSTWRCRAVLELIREGL